MNPKLQQNFSTLESILDPRPTTVKEKVLKTIPRFFPLISQVFPPLPRLLLTEPCYAPVGKVCSLLSQNYISIIVIIIIIIVIIVSISVIIIIPVIPLKNFCQSKKDLNPIGECPTIIYRPDKKPSHQSRISV